MLVPAMAKKYILKAYDRNISEIAVYLISNLKKKSIPQIKKNVVRFIENVLSENETVFSRNIYL